MKELHAAVPHLQSIVLREDPSTLAQGAPFEQVLVEEVQKRPDAAVQYPISPHKQGAVFDVAPLVCAQSGAATHRQKLELEQDAVEVDSVL